MTIIPETGKGCIFDKIECMQNVLDLLALEYFWVNKKAQFQLPAHHTPFSDIRGYGSVKMLATMG